MKHNNGWIDWKGGDCPVPNGTTIQCILRGGSGIHTVKNTWYTRWSWRGEESDIISYCIVSDDLVNHPPHYTAHPSGIECIQITRHMSFNLGNALKYIWRADLKGSAIEDLEKAVWYLKDEIEKRRKSGELGASAVVKPASHTPEE